MTAQIGIVGDFNPVNATHLATDAALREHPFFVATLFVFQARSASHPLLRGFVEACARKERE